MKTCVRCRLEKEVSEFRVLRERLVCMCRACEAETNIERKYKMPFADYQAAWQAQKICPGCLKEFGTADTQKSPCQDHCDDTGWLRSFLCLTCNICIGMAHHDPEILHRLADYTQFWRESFFDVH